MSKTPNPGQVTKQLAAITKKLDQLALAPKGSKKGAGKSRSRGRNQRGGPSPAYGLFGGLNPAYFTPFDTEPGMRIPDQCSQRSLTSRSRQIQVFNPTGGTGSDQGAFAFIPGSQLHNVYPYPTYTGDLVSDWGSSATSNFYANNNTTADAYRIVSSGFRLELVSPPLESGGYVTVYTNGAVPQITSGTLPVTNTQTSGSSLGISAQRFAVQPGMCIDWHAQPRDNDAFVYSLMTGQNHSWTWAIVHMEGCSTGTKFMAEFRTDLEWIPEMNSITTQYAEPAAAWNPSIMERIANVYRQMPPVHQVAQGVRALAGAAQLGFGALHAVSNMRSTPMLTYPARR
jgi:hypothetical protein